VSAPRVALIGSKVTMWVTVGALAPAKGVKLWFRWDPHDNLLVLANETPNWFWVNESGFVYVGDLGAGATKTVEITVLAAKKGNVSLSFTPEYGGWWSGSVVGDAFKSSLLVTDVGMEIPDRELYLTEEIQPYVTSYPNITTFVYVFSSYDAHVLLTASGDGPILNWSKQEFNVGKDTFLKVPLKVEGSGGKIRVRAVFDSLDPRYPFHYEFSDEIVVRRVAGYALPPVTFSMENSTVSVDYTTFGSPKGLYLVLRFMGFYFGEGYPSPRDMNVTTVVVPLAPCDGRICTARVPLPFSPQPARPEDVMYAIRSLRGVTASVMWYDSALGFVESMPVTGYLPYLTVGGVAVGIGPSTVRLVVFGYSDAELLWAKVKVYYKAGGETRSDEFDASVSGTTFLGYRDYGLNANGSYNFVVEVYAEGRRAIPRPIPNPTDTRSLPGNSGVQIQMLKIDVPLYGATTITYNGAPPPQPVPAPDWAHDVLVLAVGLALFMVSLAGFLVSFRLAGKEVEEAAVNNLVYVFLAFAGVVEASGLLQWAWYTIASMMGVPNYGEPYNTVLVFVSVASAFLSAVIVSVVESVFALGFWSGAILALLGAITYVYPPAGAIANAAGNFIFGWFGQFVQRLASGWHVVLNQLLYAASALYVLGLTASYVMYFVYMFGPLLAVGGLALSALPPFRRAGASLFLFFTFLYVFLPVFTAPGVASMKHAVVDDMIPAIQSLNSGALNRMGAAVGQLGNVYLNYFLFSLGLGTALPIQPVEALALGAVGGVAGLIQYLVGVLYGLAELLLGMVVAFYLSLSLAEGLSGAAITGLRDLIYAARRLIYKLTRGAIW